jgi:hypothetical protein
VRSVLADCVLGNGIKTSIMFKVGIRGGPAARSIFEIGIKLGEKCRQAGKFQPTRYPLQTCHGVFLQQSVPVISRDSASMRADNIENGTVLARTLFELDMQVG